MTNKEKAVLRLHIYNAARRLDKMNKGWHNRIRLNTFELQSLNDCILGQLYGYYGDAPQELRMPAFNPIRFIYNEVVNTDPINGFIIVRDYCQEVWTKLIKNRQETGIAA